jgi:hypothetical protein
MTNMGLHMEIHRAEYEKGRPFIILPCRPINEMHKLLALPVHESGENSVMRAGSLLPFTVDRLLALKRHIKPTYLVPTLEHRSSEQPSMEEESNPFLCCLVIRSLPPHVSLNENVVFPTGSYDADLRIISTPSKYAICVDDRYVILMGSFSHLATYEKIDANGAGFDVQGWCDSSSMSLHLITPQNYKMSERYVAVVDRRPKWIKTVGHSRIDQVWPVDIIDNKVDDLGKFPQSPVYQNSNTVAR